MTLIPSIPFQWDGEHMVPKRGFAKRCDELYVVGEYYLLEPREDRSMRSHKQFFAAIHEIWMNLPLERAALHPTPEHLRHWLLIVTGYRNQSVIVAANPGEARKIAALATRADKFVVTQIDGSIVTINTAESQSLAAMKKDRFEASKRACLDEGAALIGKTREAVEAHAKTADVP